MSEQTDLEQDTTDDAEPGETTDATDDAETEEHEQAEHEREQAQDDAPQAVDQKVIDKVFGQLTKEAERHAGRVGDIMGDSANALDLCPTCAPIDGMPNLPGFVLKAALPDLAVARMRTALGLNDETNVKPDPYSNRCATCDGWGVVQTGSHVPNLEVRSCDDCSGQGFVLLNAPAKPAPFVPTNGTETAAPIAPPAALGPEPPEAASLRARGWAVIPPMQSATA